MKRIVRNYYTVDVPRDFSEDATERANAAFIAAEELTRLYFMPARWWIVWDRGDNVRVCRAHYARWNA